MTDPEVRTHVNLTYVGTRERLAHELSRSMPAPAEIIAAVLAELAYLGYDLVPNGLNPAAQERLRETLESERITS